MYYPDDCIAIGAKGKKEARVLRSKGADFIVYGYADAESKKALGKYSILLRKEGGDIEHLFIVPSAGGKELVVKHETGKAKKRGIYDEKKNTVEYF